MAYQEVTKTSYGSRLGSSLKGIVSGLLLLVIATIKTVLDLLSSLLMTKDVFTNGMNTLSKSKPLEL